MKIPFRFAAFSILIAWIPACLGATNTITFDDLTFEGPFAFAAYDRYKSNGIIFSREIPIENVSVAEPGYFPTFSAAGASGSNALALTDLFRSGRSIELSFIVPGTSTPGTTTHVRALFGDTDVGTTLGTIDAFDTNGTIIASSTLPTVSSTPATLEVNTQGISGVRLSVDSDGVDIDNVEFDVPTGLPPTPLTVSIYPAVEIAWVSEPTRLYQVQCSADCCSGWQDLGFPMTPTARASSVFDRIGSQHRFYRVVLLR